MTKTAIQFEASGSLLTMKVIENVTEAWREITDHCMNDVWRKVWLECSKDFMGFKPEVPTLHN